MSKLGCGKLKPAGKERALDQVKRLPLLAEQ